MKIPEGFKLSDLPSRTKKEKLDLLKNIESNTTWFNLNEIVIFKLIVRDIERGEDK